jgi:hypothetical protein
MLALAIALGAKVNYDASLVWTVPLAVIAVLTAVSLGFAIAGWMATPESANQLNIAFSALVFQLAGIMYPLAGLPTSSATSSSTWSRSRPPLRRSAAQSTVSRSPITPGSYSSPSAGSCSPSPSPPAPTASPTSAAPERDRGFSFR